MSSHEHQGAVPPMDLSKWRNVPVILIVIGAIGAGAGLLLGGVRQFAFSWLLGFMFVLSLGVGAWFLVIVHHLFDASWSVPIRRYCEHMACFLGPALLVLFLPIAFLADVHVAGPGSRA
jgi:protein-S-isoprenylcysteine O-methyltransferase Ste14